MLRARLSHFGRWPGNLDETGGRALLQWRLSLSRRFYTLPIILVLTLSAIGVSAPHRVTAAQSGGVDVVSSSSYTSRTGSLRVVGEVVNNTSETVEFVKVIVSLRAGDDRVVATDTAYTDVSELLPGETSPFQSLTLDPPPGIARYELTVEYRRASRQPLRGFEVEVGSVRRGSTGSLRITGEVRNGTAVAAEFVQVLAALYDANGTVIRVDSTYSERDQVEAGGRSPFEILILDAPEYQTYKLWVDGRPAR